jgi:hypothetical protein
VTEPTLLRELKILQVLVGQMVPLLLLTEEQVLPPQELTLEVLIQMVEAIRQAAAVTQTALEVATEA